jgi:AraC-like DNA-binding protein
VRLRCGDRRHANQRDWLDEVVIESQLLAGRVAFVHRDDARRLLSDFVRSLPSPVTQIEWIVMRGLLMEVAYRSGSILHDRVHGGKTVKCDFVCATLLNGFYGNTTRDLADTFLTWLDTFLTELDRTHPPSVAARVSELIKREYTRSWTLATLTRRFGVSSMQLRRDFSNEFGVSIPRYQLTMRIVAAIDDLRGGKADAVALRAGYRSKKNFYRAFTRLTGVTVSEFRKLPPDRAMDIQETAKLRLVRHPGAGARRHAEKAH